MTQAQPPFLAIVAVVLCGCAQQGAPSESRPTYSTEYGLGPDKWATAWLLTKRPGTSASLFVAAAGEELSGTPFDIPEAPVRRIGNRAAFEVALNTLQLQDPVAAHLAQIVHEIEVNFWSSEGPPEAQVVENAYRGLQQRYGRDRVSPECYVAFFDRVYRVLKDARERQLDVDASRLSMPCDELVAAANARDVLIPEVPVADVLSTMAAGRRVVFVDVREAGEFAEGHIPGAVNIPLRDVGEHLAARFDGADYVVSYCVKDFRGFEMAKALANAGVKNSVIMRPYGIKGWVAAGLPVTGTKALEEQAARARLSDCLESRGHCLETGAAGEVRT